MYEPLTSLIPRVESETRFDQRTRGDASADVPAPGNNTSNQQYN